MVPSGDAPLDGALLKGRLVLLQPENKMAHPMTLALFGASGRTGQALVRVAAARGVVIRALCRPAAQLDAAANLATLRSL
jgi:hypothetical protein